MDVVCYMGGDWILVKYTTKKTLKHYVGQIERFNETGNPIVKYLRVSSQCSYNTTFKYPDKEDIDEVDEDFIISHLPEPSTGRREDKIFGVTFSQYNLQ